MSPAAGAVRVKSLSSPLPYVLAVVKGNTHWNATALSVDDEEQDTVLWRLGPG
jgi:hypothetical protein